jgi:valyl-tRNA synthetase
MICHDGEDLPDEVKNHPDDWKRDEDVLDTWFSSALWPFSTLGWPEKTDELAKFYPTSVLVTGHDILFFWVARMILMGEFVMKAVPFQETFLHGLIYGKSYWRTDAKGQAMYLPQSERLEYDLGKEPRKDISTKWEKMSKTKGNVIDPLEIIETYGADAMRMALLSSLTHARQIDLDRRRFEEFKNFSNKLWNSARFVFLNLEQNDTLQALSSESFSKGLDLTLFSLEDSWILQMLNQTIVDVEKHLTAYEFDKASQCLYSFFWDKFCAYYVEIVKPTLFGKTGAPALRENKQKLLVIVLLASIRLMHPMTPFITEELFQRLKLRFPSTSMNLDADPYTQQAVTSLNTQACMVAPYPQAYLYLESQQLAIEKDFEFMNQLLYSIRNLRGEMQLAPGVACDLYFIADPSSKEMLKIKKHAQILTALVRIKSLHFETSCPKHLQFCANLRFETLQMVIPLPEELKEKEKQRLISQKEKLELQAADLKVKLSNEDFVGKAPKALVENTQKSLSEILLTLSDIQEKLLKL